MTISELCAVHNQCTLLCDDYYARGASGSSPVEYLYRRVASTHDLNAILFPPSSENTVHCIAV